jgi:hypothetical protein
MNRIIFSNNGTLKDITIPMYDYKNQTEVFDYVLGEDALYIGSWLPFNHLYFKLTAVNIVASTVNISVWDNNQWKAVADIMDETLKSGASLGQSGFITWTPDKNSQWGRDDTVNTSGVETITGLGGVKIYDRYWIKVTFSTSLTATTSIKWIGNLFSNDNDLKSEYPDLLRTSVLTGFETGKTTWEEQHVVAAKIIIQDLTNQNTIVNPGQIMEKHQLTLASVQKVAELIYSSFGDDGDKDRVNASKEYNRRLSKAVYTIDRNINGIADREEIIQTQGVLLRR